MSLARHQARILLLLCSLALVSRSVAQFETLVPEVPGGSGSDAPSDTGSVNGIADPTNLTPGNQMNQMFTRVSQISETVTQIDKKLDNLPTLMSADLERTLDQLSSLTRRVGVVGDLIELLADHWLIAGVIVLSIPLLLLLMQLLILCRICCLDRRGRRYNYGGSGRDDPLELSDM